MAWLALETVQPKFFVWTTGGPDRVEIVDYHQADSAPHAR